MSTAGHILTLVSVVLFFITLGEAFIVQRVPSKKDSLKYTRKCIMLRRSLLIHAVLTNWLPR